jgi:4-amino-4-deoxy-L-arabinose transferase-like glycosyltransferase
MNPPADAVSVSERASSGLSLSSPGWTASSPTNTAALVLLLLIGFALLLYKFPSVPVGLHQDEMSEAYESYSLLHTGADRWGYHLPVYFIGWGSGQNVMQAYLSIPVVAVLGLTRVSARLVPILCGLLTLPLFFYTLRRWFDEDTALLGLFFLAFSPWHLIYSRFGVENSPLPFFMLLGIYTFSRALQSQSAWFITVCLLPFVMALYTYGLVIVILPVLLPLLFLIDASSILKRWRPWLGAIVLLIVAALPLVFFTFKNYVTKKNYAFERHLPFSVPLLPVSRLSEARSEDLHHSTFAHNVLFLRHGLSDSFPWNSTFGIPIFPYITLLLAFAGIAYLLVQIVRTRRLQEPFLLCVLSCVPIFFLMPVDVSRMCALYLPLLAMAAVGAHAAFTTAQLRRYRVAIAAVCLIFFAVSIGHFFRSYYGSEYAGELSNWNYPELPDTLAKTLKTAGPAMPVYITDRILLNNVQVLFLTNTDPAVYQRSGATYDHKDFGRYRFTRSTLVAGPRPFAYLIKNWEPPVCDAPVDTSADGQFLIGVCR